MATELVYTSLERGLRPHTEGFCTVAMTRGLLPNLVSRLETLSGYKNYYPAHDPKASSNPVNYSYYRFSIAGQLRSVISRACFAGFDYSGRSNTLAHHLVLDESEQSPVGPVSVMRQPGLMLQQWSGDARWLEPRSIPVSVPLTGPAHTWQTIAGDAGWAGVVAEHTLAALDRGSNAAAVALAYPPGFDPQVLLKMLDEAMRLIPPARRWDVTFSTYCTDLPTGTSCLWRCVLADSPEWTRLVKQRDVLAIDLTTRMPGSAPAGELVEAARTGSDPHRKQLTAPEAPAAADEMLLLPPKPQDRPIRSGRPLERDHLEEYGSLELKPRVSASAPPARPVNTLPTQNAPVYDWSPPTIKPGTGSLKWILLGVLVLGAGGLIAVRAMTKGKSASHSIDSPQTTAPSTQHNDVQDSPPPLTNESLCAHLTKEWLTDIRIRHHSFLHRVYGLAGSAQIRLEWESNPRLDFDVGAKPSDDISFKVPDKLAGQPITFTVKAIAATGETIASTTKQVFVIDWLPKVPDHGSIVSTEAAGNQLALKLDPTNITDPSDLENAIHFRATIKDGKTTRSVGMSIGGTSHPKYPIEIGKVDLQPTSRTIEVTLSASLSPKVDGSWREVSYKTIPVPAIKGSDSATSPTSGPSNQPPENLDTMDNGSVATTGPKLIDWSKLDPKPGHIPRGSESPGGISQDVGAPETNGNIARITHDVRDGEADNKRSSQPWESTRLEEAGEFVLL